MAALFPLRISGQLRKRHFNRAAKARGEAGGGRGEEETGGGRNGGTSPEQNATESTSAVSLKGEEGEKEGREGRREGGREGEERGKEDGEG